MRREGIALAAGCWLAGWAVGAGAAEAPAAPTTVPATRPAAPVTPTAQDVETARRMMTAGDRRAFLVGAYRREVARSADPRVREAVLSLAGAFEQQPPQAKEDLAEVAEQIRVKGLPTEALAKAVGDAGTGAAERAGRRGRWPGAGTRRRSGRWRRSPRSSSGCS